MNRLKNKRVFPMNRDKTSEEACDDTTEELSLPVLKKAKNNQTLSSDGDRTYPYLTDKSVSEGDQEEIATAEKLAMFEARFVTLEEKLRQSEARVAEATIGKSVNFSADQHFLFEEDYAHEARAASVSGRKSPSYPMQGSSFNLESMLKPALNPKKAKNIHSSHLATEGGDKKQKVKKPIKVTKMTQKPQAADNLIDVSEKSPTKALLTKASTGKVLEILNNAPLSDPLPSVKKKTPSAGLVASRRAADPATGEPINGSALGHTLLASDAGFLGTFKCTAVVCGMASDSMNMQVASNIPDAISGVEKLAPHHVKTTTRSGVKRAIDESMVFLASASASASKNMRDRSYDKTHTALIVIAAHANVQSLNDRTLEAEILVSPNCSMEMQEIAADISKAIAQNNLGPACRVVLYFATCFTAPTCVRTQKSLSAITTEQPLLTIITHREKVATQATFDFTLALNRAFLSGKVDLDSATDEAVAAGTRYVNKGVLCIKGNVREIIKK